MRIRFFSCTNLDLWENAYCLYHKYFFNPVHIIPTYVIEKLLSYKGYFSELIFLSFPKPWTADSKKWTANFGVKLIEFSRSILIMSIYKFSDCFFISNCILSVRPWSWVDIGVIKIRFGTNFEVNLIDLWKS